MCIYIYIYAELWQFSPNLNGSFQLADHSGAKSLPLGGALHITFGESSSGTGQNTKQSRGLSGFGNGGGRDLNQA